MTSVNQTEGGLKSSLHARYVPLHTALYHGCQERGKAIYLFLALLCPQQDYCPPLSDPHIVPDSVTQSNRLRQPSTTGSGFQPFLSRKLPVLSRRLPFVSGNTIVFVTSPTRFCHSPVGEIRYCSVNRACFRRRAK